MSIPRAATSVATKILSLLSANLPNAFSRAFCGMSPCKADASAPSFCNASATLSQLRLVSQNTTVWPAAAAMLAITRSLSMWCTAKNKWRIVPTVSVGESIETSTGFFMYRLTRLATCPSSVAENNIVWCTAVTWRMIHSTWGINPSSAMRSASSIATI